MKGIVLLERGRLLLGLAQWWCWGRRGVGLRRWLRGHWRRRWRAGRGQRRRDRFEATHIDAQASIFEQQLHHAVV